MTTSPRGSRTTSDPVVAAARRVAESFDELVTKTIKAATSFHHGPTPASEPLKAYNGESVTLLPPEAYDEFVKTLDEPTKEMPLLAKISANAASVIPSPLTTGRVGLSVR